MGVSGKFLFLFIAIIALQEIYARSYFDVWRWKNLGYEINKASDDAERDVRKDLLNVKNNIWKDTNKFIMKVNRNDPVAACVLETQKNSLMEVDNISVTTFKCIEDVRERAGAIEDDMYDPRELNYLKNTLKNKIKACRNLAKDNFKMFQRMYPVKLYACLKPESPSPEFSPEEVDIDDSSPSL